MEESAQRLCREFYEVYFGCTEAGRTESEGWRIADCWKDYEVIDTSNGEKLERWGNYILVRPDPQVIGIRHIKSRVGKRTDIIIAKNRGGGECGVL